MIPVVQIELSAEQALALLRATEAARGLFAKGRPIFTGNVKLSLAPAELAELEKAIEAVEKAVRDQVPTNRKGWS